MSIIHFTRRASTVAALILCLCILVPASLAQPPALGDVPAFPGLSAVQGLKPGAFAPGRVLVTWRPDSAKADLAQALNTAERSVLQTLDPLPAAVLAVPEGRELAAIADLQANPLIASAEPDYLAYAAGAAPVSQSAIATPGYYPNDNFWAQQWGMRRIQAPLAWPVSTGQPTALVAMIDSGIDLAHPEFAGRIVPGYDYVNQDNVPQDDYGHGTHIAGIVAAAGDNALGVAGVAWDARLLVYKALDNRGIGPASYVAQAVLDATARGASVINLSLSLTGPSDVLHSAIRSAYANGAFIVGVAGNESGPVTYPALYEEVIAVGATTRWEDWSGYSNYGPDVDLAAPGGAATDQILSTGLSGGYAWQYGTSSAAPHVAGVAALMRSVAPQLSNTTIAAILRNTADKVGAYPYFNGRNDYLGYGRLNAAKAVRQALAPGIAFDPDRLDLLAAVANPYEATASIVLRNSSSQPLSWQIVEISADWLDLEPPWSGSLAYPTTATLRARVIAPQPVGEHTASIRLRTTTLGGQVAEQVLPVRLKVAPSLRQVHLPLVESQRVTASWFDLSSDSTSVFLGDDGAEVIGLPFSYPFYGVNYTEAWVHANGFLSFGRGYAGSQYAANGCVPSLQPPDGAIYALWTDLDPSRGGQIRYRNVDNEVFVVEWRAVPRRGSSAPNTFQIAIWPDGRVLLQYQAVADPTGVTIGLENWDNTMGWQMACNGSGALPTPERSWLVHTALR